MDPTKESEAFRTSLYLKIMKKNLLLLLLFGVIPAGFASCTISFEEIDSLQRIEKEKRLFSFKPIGANFAMR
jgi:hypothetical protein